MAKRQKLTRRKKVAETNFSESEIISDGGFRRDRRLPFVDPNPDAHPYKLRGNNTSAGLAYQILVSDPQVYQGFDKQILTLASLNWDIIPPSKATPEEEAQTEFIKSSYQEIDGGFLATTVLRPMWSRILGFSVSEIVRDIDEETGLWITKKILWIPPWSVAFWIVDENDLPLGIVLFDNHHRKDKKARLIPWDKLHYEGQMWWGRNFEGIPVTRPLLYYWDHKSSILSNDLVARKRASSGIAYANPPQGIDMADTAEYDEANAILDRIATAAEDEEVSYVAPSGGWTIGVNYLDGIPDPSNMLNYLDHTFAGQMTDHLAEVGQNMYGSKATSREYRIEKHGMLGGICACKAHNIDQQIHRPIYNMNGWNTRRMCRTVATGLQDQILYRRIFEYLTGSVPDNPIIPITPELQKQLLRSLGVES